MNKILFHTLRLSVAIILYTIAFSIIDMGFWKSILIFTLIITGVNVQNIKHDAYGRKDDE